MVIASHGSPTCSRLRGLVLAAGVLCSAATRLAAQSPGAEALAVLQRFFDDMRRRDTAGMRAALAPEARLSLLRGRGDSLAVLGITGEQFIARIADPAAPALREVVRDPVVQVAGELVAIWAEYQVQIEGRVSHCGHDAVHLMRLAGEWKLVHLSDDVPTASCGEPWRPAIESRWILETGAPVRSTPAVAEGLVFVANEAGLVVAAELATGHERWRTELNSAVSSALAVTGDLILAADRGGRLSALARSDGALRWQTRIGDSVFVDRQGRPGRSRYDPWDYFVGSPLVDGERVYVGAPDGSLVALRAEDGRLLWRAKTGGPIRATPVLVGDVVAIGSFDGRLHGFGAGDGKRRWSFTAKGNPDFPRGEFQGSAVAVDGDLVVGSRDYRIYRIDGRSGRLVWEVDDGSWVIARPALAAGWLYVGASDSHMVRAIDPGTGAGRWSTNVGANVFGDVLLRDDLVIVATTEIYSRADRGYLIALDQRTGAERWRIKTRGNVRSTPLAHGDDLVVGTESGTLEVWRVRR